MLASEDDAGKAAARAILRLQAGDLHAISGVPGISSRNAALFKGVLAARLGITDAGARHLKESGAGGGHRRDEEESLIAPLCAQLELTSEEGEAVVGAMHGDFAAFTHLALCALGKKESLLNFRRYRLELMNRDVGDAERNRLLTCGDHLKVLHDIMSAHPYRIGAMPVLYGGWKLERKQRINSTMRALGFPAAFVKTTLVPSLFGLASLLKGDADNVAAILGIKMLGITDVRLGLTLIAMGCGQVEERHVLALCESDRQLQRIVNEPTLVGLRATSRDDLSAMLQDMLNAITGDLAWPWTLQALARVTSWLQYSSKLVTVKQPDGSEAKAEAGYSYLPMVLVALVTGAVTVVTNKEIAEASTEEGPDDSYLSSTSARIARMNTSGVRRLLTLTKVLCSRDGMAHTDCLS
jgi:hypothetical protein